MARRQRQMCIRDSSGWINVGNERVFALSEGNFIDKDVKVVILSVDGNRVVVRKK